MHNVLTGAEANDDASASVLLFRSRLNNIRVGITFELLEKLFYHTNMNAENGTYWHPDNMTVRNFIKENVPTDHFYDFSYNLILHKEENE